MNGLPETMNALYLDHLRQRLNNHNYELVECLGSGTFGQAWRLINKQDKKHYVCKTIPIVETGSRQTAMNEMALLRGLKHENIVTYVDHVLDKHETTLFIIMEFCRGGDLSAFLTKKRDNEEKLDEDWVWNWILQVFYALEYLHGRKPKVLHRDLKPANIFLTVDLNTIKLGDFGVSKSLPNAGDLTQTVCGSPQYLSPEIMKEQPYDHKGDIWAAGCCLYEMMALQPATDVDWTRRILHVNAMPRGYSPELVGIARDMLNLEPSLRPDIKDVLARPCVVQKRLSVHRIPRPLPRLHKQRTDSSDGPPTSPIGKAERNGDLIDLGQDEETLRAPVRRTSAAAPSGQDPPDDDNEYLQPRPIRPISNLSKERTYCSINVQGMVDYRHSTGGATTAIAAADDGDDDDDNVVIDPDRGGYVRMDGGGKNRHRVQDPTPPNRNQDGRSREVQHRALASNPDEHVDRELDMKADPQAELLTFGYKFHDDGVMRDKNGRTYIHDNDDEGRYEAICKAMTKYIYHLLDNKYNMHMIALPLDADAKEPIGFIYASSDVFDNKQKLLVLIHGSGRVLVGQWSRRLIINESLDEGSQIPWLIAAQKEGYAVVMANMNYNSQIIGGVPVKIRRNETPERHLQDVWWFVSNRCPAERVAFFVHSAGGNELLRLAAGREDEFLKKTFAVAFSDSVHERRFIKETISNAVSKFFNKHSRNYMPDTKPLGTKLPSEKCFSPRYSAGDVEHERTPTTCRRKALEFIEEEFLASVNPAAKRPTSIFSRLGLPSLS